ncbi:hypothetical protein RBS60_04425 [Sinomonas sp. ASV486]|uniref:hypothetical protein n=1 Tax=Sinomonas sp. ASV486 TaxID=3051170 RepID=UPI0027DAF391|nr:hypothetical protein [Sinomonas sp. ASV486]MDQ4489444.1 hypothetical protein [Sinomonas sp. ASV486]
MKVTQRIGYAAASAAAVAALIGGGAAVANAATTPSPSATSGGSSSGSSSTHGPGGQHTAASADETSKVTAAVKAKDANANVTKVEKDADGSFDATATSNGSTVRYEVSADYATVTQNTHAGHGMGGGQRTPLSSDELSKVTAAVKAKDANATVKDSWKDSDGSFDVVATSGSTTTKYDVSADYKTVTADTNFGMGGHRMHDGANSGSASGSASSGTTQG